MGATLWAAVQNRYSAQTLILYTNADLPANTTLDSTKGTTVSDDAEQWFKRVVGIAFDSTDAAHIPVGVLATYVLLREYAGKTDESVKADRERCVAEMKDLASRTASKRITPHSSMVPTPSTEDTSTETERPLFDWRRFDGVTPNSPPTPT
jgi:hypothetical protein